MIPTVARTRAGHWLRVHYLPGPHGLPTPFGHNSADPDFVLVHGIGVSSRYFVPLAEELSRTGDVYLIDLPGFARLPRPRRPLTIGGFAAALDAIVGELSLDQPVFVGHSMGAQVVTELLAGGRNIAHFAAEAGAVLIGPPVNHRERRLVPLVLRFLQSSRHEPSSIRRIAVSAYLSTGPEWFFSVLPHMMNYPIEDRIRHVPCPVTLLRGEYDAVAPQAWIDLLARNAGDGSTDPRAGSCTHVTVRGAAHSVIYDHDDVVYDAVLHLVEHHAPR
jgi:pimeloyl-ACP methyl ester carboxylesterase